MLFESQEDQLIRSAARRLKGRERRLFIAEVTIELCDGSARVSEDRFGWGRETASKGMQERGHPARPRRHGLLVVSRGRAAGTNLPLNLPFLAGRSARRG